jgi:hypothetical protein
MRKACVLQRAWWRLQGRHRHTAQTNGNALDLHGSNAIIALRCAKLSGRFQDFWERRTEQEAA